MKRFHKSWALAAILTATLASVLAPRAAAQDATISGTVLDLEGKPWADFGVNLESDLGSKMATKTDKGGKYSFTGLRPGVYKITVMLPLQKDPYLAGQVKVNSGQTVPTDLNLMELVAKKNPDYVAAVKKQGEEVKKSEGMKAHFDAGIALLEQEKAAKAELQKASADQRDAAKQKLSGLSDQAAKEFQAAQQAAGEKDPNIHKIWARLAEAYDTAGRNDDAAQAYQQAIAAKPDAGYYNNMGNVLARAGKIEEAKAAYTKSAELDPPNAAGAWRNFGISLYNANRLADAIEPLQKATELDPKSAQAWYLLGASLLMKMTTKKVGDREEVQLAPGTVEAYQKAEELDPNGPWGQQAKQGLTDLKALGAGIETKVNLKKKKS